MRALALRVDRRNAESWRRRLRRSGELRLDLEVDSGPGYVYLPITASPADLGPSEIVEHHEFRRRTAAAPTEYRELVDLPPALRRQLPRAFDVVGDIVVVRVPEALAEYAPRIGAALLEFVPGARVVGSDDGVHGASRIRRLTVIAGDGGFATTHRENELGFAVDLERAYFSPRLAREHDRVASLVRPGERVLDLCAGVGPFAVTIAARVPTVTVRAVDLNPSAVELLRANAAAAHVEARVEAFCQDATEFLRQDGRYDRVVLNLPHDGERFLPALRDRVTAGGTVHYYEVVDRTAARNRPAELLERLGGAGLWHFGDSHVVHEYSPRADLRQFSFTRGSP
ncbi:MAG TPA: methyltransferase [Thermoplasmata archaeon]|nr:methyltransferase [Thermoplasmata archaeon]